MASRGHGGNSASPHYDDEGHQQDEQEMVLEMMDNEIDEQLKKQDTVWIRPAPGKEKEVTELEKGSALCLTLCMLGTGTAAARFVAKLFTFLGCVDQHHVCGALLTAMLGRQRRGRKGTAVQSRSGSCARGPKGEVRVSVLQFLDLSSNYFQEHLVQH